MRQFRVHLVLNNIHWPSLPKKLDDARAFYAPVLDLKFSFEVGSYAPDWRNDYPGLSPLDVINFDWYDQHVSLPHIADADIVVFVQPKSAAYNTFQGLMSHCNVGPYEIQLFAGGENDTVLVNGISYGDAFTHYLCHELSHVFYEDLGKADATHVHFPVGQHPYLDHPVAVLADFQDYPDGPNAILQQIARQLAGAAVALGIIAKQRTVKVADSKLVPDVPVKTDPNLKLYDLAKAALGKDIAKTQDELGCAEAVSGLLHAAYGDFPAGVLSTYTLYEKLSSHAKFERFKTSRPLSWDIRPGDVVVSPTGSAIDPQEHGHTGVAGKYGILSNDSATGLFKENYTFDAWDDRYRSRGFPVFLFRRTA